MNNYIFYVSGNSAFEYLGGTNYTNVWADTLDEAYDKVSRYFQKGTCIEHVSYEQAKGKTIGCLY